MEPLTVTLIILGAVLAALVILGLLCLIAKLLSKTETYPDPYPITIPRTMKLAYPPPIDIRPAQTPHSNLWHSSIEAPKITWSANYVDKIRGEAIFRGTVMSTGLKQNCIMAKIDYQVLPLPPAGPKHPSMRIQTRIDAIAPYTLSDNAISRRHFAETVYTAMAWIHEQVRTMEYHVHDTVIEDSMRMMGLDTAPTRNTGDILTNPVQTPDHFLHGGHTHLHNHVTEDVEHDHYHRHTASYHHHR